MNNTISEIDLTRALPPPLRQDKEMLALAQVIGAELQENSRLARLNIIYARIDELPENVLDILAYDLHVDWYDFDYPIEAKRGVIRDSVKVHKRLGTVYATLTALRSVYPASEIEEWFDYNGEPFTFRVVLDVTRAKAPAEYFHIKRAIDSYKRLTAHLDSLVYQCRIDLEMRIETRWWWLSAHRTGKSLAGTYPQRSIKAAIRGGQIEIVPNLGRFGFTSTPAGTAPQRSTGAALREAQIEAHSGAEAFAYKASPAGRETAGTRPQRATQGAIAAPCVGVGATGKDYPIIPPKAGTEPQRNTGGGAGKTILDIAPDGDGFCYAPPPAGIVPERTTRSQITESGIDIESDGRGQSFSARPAGTEPRRSVSGGTETGRVDVSAETAGYLYDTPLAGTTPERANHGRPQAVDVAVTPAASGYSYAPPPAGTAPHRASGFAAGDDKISADTDAQGFPYMVDREQPGTPHGGGIIPSVTADCYTYRVKRCGTNRCKK